MDALRKFLKGFRTLGTCLAFLLTGLLSVIGSLDLTPLVALFVENPAMLGAVMVCVGALFGYLRYLTNTPLFSPYQQGPQGIDEAPEFDRRPRSLDEGE